MTSTDTTGAGRIGEAFASNTRAGRKGLCPFVCAGYPEAGVLARTLPLLQEAGATMVEVGVPFSDPIADGPVIAGAMHQALEMGTTPTSVLGEIIRARQEGVTLPIVLMASVSLVEHAGAEVLAQRMATSGVDGVILPDCPLEEAPAFAPFFHDAGLATSLLVAPTSPPERAARIADACTGFVYVLTRTGITGTDAPDADPLSSLRDRVDKLRAVTDLPLACGFGIASASDVRRVVRDVDADGAIVGTTLVRAMSEAHNEGRDAPRAAAELTRALAEGCQPV